MGKAKVFKHQGLISFLCFMNKILFHRKEIFSMEYDYVSTMEAIKIQCSIKGIKHDD